MSCSNLNVFYFFNSRNSGCVRIITGEIFACNNIQDTIHSRDKSFYACSVQQHHVPKTNGQAKYSSAFKIHIHFKKTFSCWETGLSLLFVSCNV